MDSKENDSHSLSKKDDFQEAVEQLFYASPFHEILNSFQKLISDQLENSSISMNIRDEKGGLYVDITVPESFQNGDIMIEAKSRYLHVALKEAAQNGDSASFTSLSRTVLLPYPVREETMKTAWNRNVLTISFPDAKKHE
ncbi:Hsp20/alpha crystallin family protein [Bacillus swezeyi]|uniref:SHSP domain-containing protein n=1 Tax=Bacillus swezeyi TaxID=1925020 RepID=A0A1R1QCH2_9BACI|nr:Hsp20/alpha crystallin family protein [Bacillus swezeyi]MEC1260577.1 Hsp20/alpha crystallin family protein [Bacillus swezeyi]MED1740992.1 Hsp20/alpha crystallin family protein [Bacillus swezeyi]MED2929680.1 Hsp20/alpha crystallin family protein [Bacillus swezeyi]MED2943571.1 Hsp20/alpha crystallin family protein [Bacillus swezeyi]MED2963293.1 Hsp20/alpha crystallin family protein [Bacillus swezeyi]